MVAPRDTSRDAWLRQVDAYRQMRPDERLRIASDLAEEVRSIALAGIHDRHPELSERQAQEALEELLLGTELAVAARRWHRSQAG